jgi:hypothetical protein
LAFAPGLFSRRGGVVEKVGDGVLPALAPDLGPQAGVEEVVVFRLLVVILLSSLRNLFFCLRLRRSKLECLARVTLQPTRAEHLLVPHSKDTLLWPVL